MDRVSILLGMANFLSILFWIINCRRLRHIIRSSRRVEFGEFDLKYALESAVKDSLSQRTKSKIEDMSECLVDDIANESIKERIYELSVELADKYTLEHFEDQLKKSMKERIGSDIRNNIMGHGKNKINRHVCY